MLWWMSGLLSMLTGTATRLLLPSIVPQIIRSGFVSTNYRGRTVAGASGIVPIIVYSASLFFWLLVPLTDDAPERVYALGLLVTTLAFALIGFVDDVVGDRSSGGLGGHLRRLFAGEVTTGSLKAIFGAVAAAAAAAIVSTGVFEWLVNGLLIALSANAVNLLDVRPGRGLKGFFAAVLLLLFVDFRNVVWIVLWPCIVAVVAYAPEDFRERTLLGDAGANALGALVGFAGAAILPFTGKVAVILGLCLLHFFTERVSLSAIVEKVPLLRRMDEWGRR